MSWHGARAGALAFGLAVSGVGSASAAPVRYDDHRVLRVWPVDEDRLARLITLVDDVWTERPRVGGSVDVRVSAASQARLDAEGFVYEVRIANVQATVDAERARLSVPVDPSAAPSEWFSDFRDLDTINAYMDELAGQQPGLVSLETVGMSLEGREIRAFVFDSPATTDKSAMLVTGTQHAREWLSPMTVMCIAEAMITGYGADPATTELLDALQLVIVPVVNPDGYVYSWEEQRYWRKNTRGGYGVDLNRNWAHAWGGEGSSNYPYDENFHGEGPLSEPETAAVAAYVEANDRLVAHVDVHAYGELVIYPWGHRYDAAPDEGMLSELAGQMSSAIADVHGHMYAPIQGADFYVASGVADDWSYGDNGLMAFTIELRGNDFVIPPSEIIPTCEENLGAIEVLAQWARMQSEPVPVPEDPGTTTSGGSSGDEPSADTTLGAGDTAPMGAETGSSGTGLPGGTSTSSSAGADAQDSGCGCRQTPEDSGREWLWLALVALGLRRARPEPTRRRGRTTPQLTRR